MRRPGPTEAAIIRASPICLAASTGSPRERNHVPIRAGHRVTASSPSIPQNALKSRGPAVRVGSLSGKARAIGRSFKSISPVNNVAPLRLSRSSRFFGKFYSRSPRESCKSAHYSTASRKKHRFPRKGNRIFQTINTKSRLLCE